MTFVIRFKKKMHNQRVGRGGRESETLLAQNLLVTSYLYKFSAGRELI